MGPVRRAEYRRAIQSAKHRPKRMAQGELMDMIESFDDRDQERDYSPTYIH